MGATLGLARVGRTEMARWAAAELRSTNAQIEFLLREALRAEGRLPGEAAKMRRPGRPRRAESDEPEPSD